MRNILPSCVALLAGLTAAMPLSLSRRADNIDIILLQFAMTLEHLENIFYKEALLRFSEDDFQKAGFDKKFFEKLLFVVEDEQSHVQLLGKAIAATGTTPVAACNYNFPYTDVQSFVTLSSVLEGVGTSAYLGAASLVTDKTILTTAASIMVTEALHTSQQRDALNLIPAANALGTPLGANAVFTLAASFIVSCPSSNAALPFKAFPLLGVDVSKCPGQNSGDKKWSRRNYDSQGGNKGNDKGNNYDNNYDYSASAICPHPTIMDEISFIGQSAIPTGSFLTFVSGLTVVSIQATIVDVSISAQVPQGLGGQTYVFVTNKAVTATLMDADVLMGPAIIDVNPARPVIDNQVLRRGNEVLHVVN